MKFLSTILFAILLSISVQAQDVIRIPITSFNPANFDKDADSNEWERLTLPKKDWTEYTLVEDADKPHIKAVSTNSASGWMYVVDIDPAEYPIIEWEWKIDGVLENGDMTQKDGDDYPARIYITFDYSRRDLPLGERIKYGAMKTFTSFNIPLRSLNYVWANKASIGEIQENVFTNWVNMVVKESGNDKAGTWVKASANLYDDYLSAFDEKPKNITGIAIMTDSDNSKGSATAYYGDIILRRLPIED
ncbi:DUF3047 domain-containing protein [Balneola vulgaris]|uniref:DUF3047 domain-containing protein n=1 Tax=Balneola vulgaris TaxID=287535 RepID=UPI00037ACAA0|nr:DUF3047 domain-containing protein [Balneola vulgaris]